MMNPSKKLVFASLAFSVLLIVAVGLTKGGVVSGFGALLVALLPLAAGAFLVLAVRDFIVLGDELHRKIQLEALAIAMGGTFLVLLAGSLLPIAGIPEPDYAWPMTAMCLLWALGQMFATLRYR